MDTIFSKIIKKELPAEIVWESDSILAFRDINPVASTHILIIPKKYIKDLASAVAEDNALLGDLLLAAKEIAKQENLDSYRLVINNGAEAGQTVFHLHLHLIAGRKLMWPPG